MNYVSTFVDYDLPQPFRQDIQIRGHHLVVGILVNISKKAGEDSHCYFYRTVITLRSITEP